MSPSFALLVMVSALQVGAAAPKPDAPPPGAGTQARAVRRLDIKVTDAGFEPRRVTVKRGEATTLAFTRVSDRTCMTAIDIPDENVKGLELPLNRTVTITITPKKKGTEPFHCSAMGMGNGKIVVDD